MKRSSALMLLALVAAATGLMVAGGASGGTESAAADRCLRGSWRASRAEAQRILRILTGGTKRQTRRAASRSWRGGDGASCFISKFRGMKDGQSITVAGPGPSTRSIPAGPVPYTCRAGSMNMGIPGRREAIRFLRAS